MTAFCDIKKVLPRFFGVLVAVLCVLSVSCKKTIDDEDDEEEGEVSGPVTEYSDRIVINLEGITYTLRKVTGGTFAMGADTARDDQSQLDERIVHNVTLSTYFIGETEVTQALWTKVTGTNPSYFQGATLPVESVSFSTIMGTFIPQLNRATGLNLRLPTEAEWEFAARGGNNSQHYRYSGSENASEVAWHTGNSDHQSHPVKRKACNELNLYDMSGNVGEWCSDWYDIYTSNSQTNPSGPYSGSHHVVRGGSWLEAERYVRSTCRMRYLPNSTNYFVGFRLAMSAR